MRKFLWIMWAAWFVYTWVIMSVVLMNSYAIAYRGYALLEAADHSTLINMIVVWAAWSSVVIMTLIEHIAKYLNDR